MNGKDWIRDIHFSMDTLKDLPRVIRGDAFIFFTSIDDKSGFDNQIM